jgi:nucleotide-binding universal stress UspA family protein
MFHKALVAVDGSPLALRALAEVPALVGAGGAALIIEVVDTPGRILAQATPAGFELGGATLSAEIVEQIVNEQHAAAEGDLADARARLAAAGVTAVETRVEEGLPGLAIVELAQLEHCDVVVMATHGRSGLSRTLLGSVADYVVRHLRGVPVLLIHPDDEAPATRATALAGARA